ncbi:MAG: ABC transporter [Sphingobacteriales bacterium 17-39-43]|uniref:ABC transporter permease n=1 Tax=Daejeonella sp. TaxID=2805397 RepID=UPI000BDD5499|nr:FtsX-like permease family protein [Daejeonella sp.]OYZ33485.1 MAG: ABC transporter [Sphingobacteriales bacterium 16-39-50]OZA24527.1 MAG: ABC transporter [Sphingobacteriales bacterium 17-39-43]HQS04673.1 ABC transporter permease [Daejeonella sp.]HQT24211.1 ABC transporter permease [Daejeonella sp.]HQT56654.1 ABC transporter permease [Daejeonella sp.]
MNFRLIFSIAQSLMLARWRQTMVAAFGVTFGIAMFVSLLGFMSGLNDLLDGLILNRTPHIRLYNEVQPTLKQPVDMAEAFQDSYNFVKSVKPKQERPEIYNNAAIMNFLKSDQRVLGIAPKITAQVFYNVGVIDLTGAVNGIDVEAENSLFNFQDYMVDGNYIDLKNTPNSIILGKGLATKMLASIGDIIQLTTSKGERLQLKVVGLFQSGLQDADNTQSYASLVTTQKLLGESISYITDIQIKVKDIEMAPQIAKEYEQLFNVEALDIQTANSQFETGSSVRSIISYAVGITLLIVAGFGIYNILNMMIYEKMDSIAILKATGFSGNDVNRIFTSIALSIGIVGGILGLVLGLSLSLLIDQIPFNTPSLPTIKTYPINYDPRFYLIGICFSLITTYLAGYLPSRKASKVDPVIIIRGK